MLRGYCVNRPHPRNYHDRDPPLEVSSAGYPQFARSGKRLRGEPGRLNPKMLDLEVTTLPEYLDQM